MKKVRSAVEVMVIDKLLYLARGFYREGADDFKDRVEFVCLAFKHGLDSDIRRYRLWDEGWEGLGERQWDLCFEMYDAEKVIAAVMARARKEGFTDAVRAYCNVPGAFERWEGIADAQLTLL